MATASSLLTLIETVIERRLNGDAYTEYTEAESRFKGEPLEKLFDLRDRLRAEVASTSTQFSLAEVQNE